MPWIIRQSASSLAGVTTKSSSLVSRKASTACCSAEGGEPGGGRGMPCTVASSASVLLSLEMIDCSREACEAAAWMDALALRRELAWISAWM